MRFLNNMSTVIFLLILAYGLYSGWSLRQIFAFAIVGWAIDVFFNAFSTEPAPEQE